MNSQPRSSFILTRWLSRVSTNIDDLKDLISAASEFRQLYNIIVTGNMIYIYKYNEITLMHSEVKKQMFKNNHVEKKNYTNLLHIVINLSAIFDFRAMKNSTFYYKCIVIVHVSLSDFFHSAFEIDDNNKQFYSWTETYLIFCYFKFVRDLIIRISRECIAVKQTYFVKEVEHFLFIKYF